MGLLVLGAEGKQIDCYTVTKNNYVPPKTPGGGGFGCESYSLTYLYEEYTMHNNVWTKSNILKDLCRFLYCKITIFRHPHTDFVLAYDRQGPFNLTKFTYPSCHPHQLLLQKHHKILLSRDSKPNGKYTKTFKIKPTKQMLNKWFFTHEFCNYTLFLIKAAACNFRFSYLSCCNMSQLVNIYSLNLGWYQDASWGQTRSATTAYKPYPTIQTNLEYQVKVRGGYEERHMDAEAYQNYATSISYDKGWFKSELLQSTGIFTSAQILTATTPVVAARYNPNIDTGPGNKIYVSSIHTTHYDPPQTDKTLLIENFPIWLGLYGYLSYMKTIKKADDFYTSHVILIQSPAILCSQAPESCKIFLPLDLSFITGKNPWDQPPTSFDRRNWYPTIKHQTKALNALVESGPFIPKYPENKDSTWELKMRYCFYFKWGGPQTNEPDVKEPITFTTYDVPDKMQKTVQIQNPQKQQPETFIYPWDIRRGIIKEQALKRMQDNLSTDTEFEYVAEGMPPKKRERRGNHLRAPEEETQEVQACLQTLFKENTFQETEEKENLHLLIQQQQLQQQELKRHILTLLFDLKHKQNLIQLHTGMIN